MATPTQGLQHADVDRIASAWQTYFDNATTDKEEQQQKIRSSDQSLRTFHEQFHALMHCDHWRPLVAQERNYFAVLCSHQRSRYGNHLLSRVQMAQRLEFVDFIKKQYDNMMKMKRTLRNSRENSREQFKEDDIDFLADEGALVAGPERKESSFTIHLGGQLKKTMNVRLIVGQVTSFLQRVESTESGYDPLHLQTCMNLYSKTLQGLVLVVDQWDCSSGLWKNVASLCSMWPELHFDPFEEQVAAARNTKDSWESGDVIVTKHSCLREVHLLFHVLLQGSKMDALNNEELNGRHPAVLALRNVMRLVWDYDVSTVTVPLFLLISFQPFMTSAWCQKRAELVFKCLKGFMIEMSSLSDDGPKTVQFLLPHNTPEAIHAEMSEMLQMIFRSSTPLIKLSTS